MSNHKSFDQVHQDVLEYLNNARLKFGRIDPHISYFERMVEDAKKENHLDKLYWHLKKNGGFDKGL